MKDAIAKFINDHPYLTYMLAGTIVTSSCNTIVKLLRGYPPESPQVSSDKLDEVVAEVVGEEPTTATE